MIVLLNQMRRQNFVIPSSRLNNILKSKLREYARSLRLAIDKGNTDNELRVQIAGMMAEVYRYVDQFILQTFNFFRQHYRDSELALLTQNLRLLH